MLTRPKNRLFSSRAISRLALLVGVPLSIVGGVRAVSWAAAQIKNWKDGDTLTAGDLNDSFTAVQAAATTVSYDYYDPEAHKAAARSISVTEALCTTRFGIWDSTSNSCKSPLIYGVSNVPRTDSDGAAISNCPAGYGPADCHTAMFLLNYWRLNPNRETPNGHAWCSGTMSGELNSTTAALAGSPGYWYPASASAPMVCATGLALVVDLVAPGEASVAGRTATYPRPHLYCTATTQTNPWMCVSNSLP